MFKRNLKSFFYLIFNFANFCIPKKKDRVTLITFPDFDDQCMVVSQELEGYDLNILADVPRPPRNFPLEKIHIFRRRSIAGLCKILTSRYLLLTHGLDHRFRLLQQSRQTVLNITHGMYFKRMHKLLGPSTQTPKFHYVLSTSPLFSPILAGMFGLSERSVIESNLPRANTLLSKVRNNELVALSKGYTKVHCWLPTYRSSEFSAVDAPDTLTAGGYADFELLNNVLAKNNELLLIKPHPSAVYKLDPKSYSNIKVITNKDLDEKKVSVYQLLAYADLLWTDYSSVFVDFMLTKKPIIFVMFDRDQYQSSRGLTLDPNKIGLPGPIIEDFETLLEVVATESYSGGYSLDPFLTNARRCDINALMAEIANINR